MDLQTFIKNTLIQIVNGVKQAEEEFNPKLDGRFFGLITGKNSGVDFQVAVTVENETKTTKGGGAKIKILEGKIDKTSKNNYEQANIIKFKIDFLDKSLRI